jgi:Tol biopolymer transport system component
MQRRIVLLVVIAFLLPPATQATATFAGAPGRLVLETVDTDTFEAELATALADGTGFAGLGIAGTNPVWSPGGRHIAYIAGDGFSVEVLDIRIGTRFVAYRAPATSQISDIAWSPDAAWIAVAQRDAAGGGHVRLVPLAGGDPADVIAVAAGDAGPELDWSPTGDTLAVTQSRAGAGHEIATVRIDGSGLTPLVAGYDPSWSPDGSQLVFVGEGGTSVIGGDGTGLRVVPGLEVHDPPAPTLSVGYAPVWSPAGDEIAVAGFQGAGAWVVDAGTGAEMPIDIPADRLVYAIDWAADTGAGPFTDVADTHTFAEEIAWLFGAEITRGCNPPLGDRFCPSVDANRGQVAALIVRAFEVPPAPTPNRFGDDDGSIFEADIDALAAAGITLGCNPPTNDRFCPEAPASRGQIAALLARTLALDPAIVQGDTFADDDGSIFEPEIEALAAAGIVRGCDAAGTQFCPEEPVTRGQLGALIARARRTVCDLFGTCPAP